MTDFVTLTCPSCGAKLQITSDIEHFACGYCGNEHIVRRRGGIIALAPIVESLGKIREGTDKTASELAVRRLGDDIRAIEQELSVAVQGIHKLSPLLRYDLQKMGKLNFWNVSFISHKSIDEMVGRLTVEELEMLIGLQGGLWLKGAVASRLERIKSLKEILRDKQMQFARHKRIVDE